MELIFEAKSSSSYVWISSLLDYYSSIEWQKFFHQLCEPLCGLEYTPAK